MAINGIYYNNLNTLIYSIYISLSVDQYTTQLRLFIIHVTTAPNYSQRSN